MKGVVLALLCVAVIAGCRGQKKGKGMFPGVDKSAKDSFLHAKNLIDTTGRGKPLSLAGWSAVIIPERMGSDEFIFDNDKKARFEMPCQCAFKNDTLTIMSALALEGVFAYVSRTAKGKTANSLMLFGDNRMWSLASREYAKEIEVPSLKNDLIISKALPVKDGEMLYGRFDIETPEFFEIDKTAGKKIGEKHILKIYFSCLVMPEIM